MKYSWFTNVSGVEQSDSVIHIRIYLFFFKFFSSIGYYKIVNIVPFAVQLALVIYLFYRQQGIAGGSDSKESACNVGDLGSISGLERSPGSGHGHPLQYSCLENPYGFLRRSLAGYSPWGSQRFRHDWSTKYSVYVNPQFLTYPPFLFDSHKFVFYDSISIL